MGIIAWIVLGLGAGLLAKLFHVVTVHGFFNLSTRLTAIAGAAVLLLAYHLLVSNRSGSRRTRQRAGWAHQ